MRNGYDPSDLRSEIFSGRSRDDRAALRDDCTEPLILIVGRDEAIHGPMSAVLGSGGYSYRCAGNLREARAVLASRVFNIVFVEPLLEDGSAADLLEALPRLSPQAIAIIVSAEREVGHAAELLTLGACALISMPIVNGSLSAHLQHIVAEWRSRTEGDRYRAHLEEMVNSTTERLLETLKQIDRIYDLSVEAMGSILDLRFPETAGHCRRVSETSALIGEAFGLSVAGLRDLRWGAYLHDVGKIAIPDHILAKPTPLTDEEFLVVKQHPARGVEILSHVDFLRGAKDAVLFHHERYDGSGYPYGLRGLEIPLAARIVAVADTMDEMLHGRPYRRASPYSVVMDHLARGGGTEYDPRVVEKFLQFHEETWFAEPLEHE